MDVAAGNAWQVGLATQSGEFNELKIKDPGFAELTLKDVDRTRTGLEFGYGTDKIRGTAMVFAEEFIDDDRATGIGIGVHGQPKVHELKVAGRDVDLLLQFDFGLSFTSAAEVEINGADGELAYGEVSSRLGLALDWHNGLISSLGLQSQDITGSVDFDGEADHEWDDEDVSGSYSSAYFGLDYAPPGSSQKYGLHATAGDVSSIGLSVTTSF